MIKTLVQKAWEYADGKTAEAPIEKKDNKKTIDTNLPAGGRYHRSDSNRANSPAKSIFSRKVTEFDKAELQMELIAAVRKAGSLSELDDLKSEISNGNFEAVNKNIMMTHYNDQRELLLNKNITH